MRFLTPFVSAAARQPLLPSTLDEELLQFAAREPQFAPLFQFAPTSKRPLCPQLSTPANRQCRLAGDVTNVKIPDCNCSILPPRSLLTAQPPRGNRSWRSRTTRKRRTPPPASRSAPRRPNTPRHANGITFRMIDHSSEGQHRCYNSFQSIRFLQQSPSH